MSSEYDKSVRIDDDGDMKIAGESFYTRIAPEDTAEDETKRFLLHKSCGNIEKAREAGIAFARALMELDSNMVLDLNKESTMLETHHRLLLCSYVVNRVIAEKSPDSLLAQTSLGAFYNEIEADSPQLHRHVSDMAAFSLYILSNRTFGGHNCSNDGDIGRIYARLCGFEGSADKIAEGNRICEKFYGFCLDILEKAGYTSI